jgi:hypothetical protein
VPFECSLTFAASTLDNHDALSGLCLNTISAETIFTNCIAQTQHSIFRFLASDYATRLTHIKNKTPGGAGRFISS